MKGKWRECVLLDSCHDRVRRGWRKIFYLSWVEAGRTTNRWKFWLSPDANITRCLACVTAKWIGEFVAFAALFWSVKVCQDDTCFFAIIKLLKGQVFINNLSGGMLGRSSWISIKYALFWVKHHSLSSFGHPTQCWVRAVRKYHWAKYHWANTLEQIPLSKYHRQNTTRNTTRNTARRNTANKLLLK